MVAFETSCGRVGAVECDVEGLESSRLEILGRGGSGGGVPSLDTEDTPLVDVLREALCIILIVGFTKSCWPTSLLFLGEAFPAAAPDACGSVFPVSSIEAVVLEDHE